MIIVATISKNSFAPEKIEEIIRAGATALRYNFSHGTPEVMKERMSAARSVIQKLGMEGKVSLIADLPGNKFRLGDFDPKEYPVKKHAIVTFKSAKYSKDPNEFIPVVCEKIGTLVDVGQVFSIADGEAAYEVTEVVDEDTLRAKALNDWYIPALKAFNVAKQIDSLDHFTPEFVAHVKNLKEIDPEWISLTFVNSAQSLIRAKQMLADNGIDLNKVKILAKVESEKGVQNIDAICKECDILVVARGDLGIRVPFERVGIYQKIMVNAARRNRIPVIVATQILDSVVSDYTPKRSDILDLTNIVLDNADGIWLAKETGISLTPGYSIEVAKKIIAYVEENKHLVLQ